MNLIQYYRDSYYTSITLFLTQLKTEIAVSTEMK